MEDNCLKLTLPSKTEYIPALRRMVSSLVSVRGYSSRESFRVETIIDELANNAVDHSPPGQRDISVELLFSSDQLEIVVMNDCSPGDMENPVGLERKMFESEYADYALRGRGLAIVKKLCQDVKVDVNNGKTAVRVVKLREGK